MTCRNDKSGVGSRQKHNTSPQFLNGMKGKWGDGVGFGLCRVQTVGERKEIKTNVLHRETKMRRRRWRGHWISWLRRANR